MRYGKVLDQSRCIGCHACTTACKSENDVPLSVSRTYVKSVDWGAFPDARRSFQVNRCNMCEHAPCVVACPTAAMYQRPDGIVDFDKRACIGCKACMAACPYDAIFINPADHSAEKCNFCAHRLDVGLEPACVVVCPVEAIFVGDLDDGESRVAATVERNPVAVRRPEKTTRPKVFYVGADTATLDPLAAERPPGGIFAWAQQARETAHQRNAGVPADRRAASQAAAIVSYDVGHAVPWDFRVGLYTCSKGIAAGVYLVAAALVFFGVIDGDGGLWRWGVPLTALASLAATGAVLVWDLEHPARFFYILTRPQWRSWLTRGAFILAAYAVVLGLHLVASLSDAMPLTIGLAAAGVPLAVLTAVYTAFLFAQARGRDLWQSRLLPAHLVVQAVLSGACVAALAPLVDDGATDAIGWTLAAASAAHLVLTMIEVARPHDTDHARLATRELTNGRLGVVFWSGAALVAVGLLGPWLAPIAAIVALAGLLAHEHAYVQAGQAVPLA